MCELPKILVQTSIKCPLKSDNSTASILFCYLFCYISHQTNWCTIDYNLKYMNQRSTSMIRKMKTDLGDEHTFQRKIARAMKEKKEFISKMTTPRTTHNMRNYSTHNSFAARPEKSLDQGYSFKNRPNIIHINRQFINSAQQQSSFGALACLNHPKKRGIFEDMHQRQQHYCHECAINLVKSNIPVVQISRQSLIVKMFLEQQIDKIAEEEAKATIAIQEYYLNLRQTFIHLYTSCHQSISRCQNIEFANFKSSQSLHKIIDALGQIEPCQLKFELQAQKQNFTNNMGTKQILQKHHNKKERSFDPRVQSNRSLETISQKNTSFVSRTRDNSFYKKNSRPDIQKMGKQQLKKGLNLR